MGARRSGGRWNSKGTAMIYTAESRALCTAEIAVHTPLGNLPPDYDLITLLIPETVSIRELLLTALPKNWRLNLRATQTQGDDFIEGNKHLVLKVPSAVVQGDSNYLINPAHIDMDKIIIQKIEPFEFDSRLFVR